MELNYSASGVDDIVKDAEDATVESSSLASDELSHYVLIKGNLNKEDETTENDKPTTAEPEAAAENSDAKEEPKPSRKSSQCRISDQFVIRKIERDRKAGCGFAAVRELKLSSSGSSSDEEDEPTIRRRGTRKTAVLSGSSSEDENDSRQLNGIGNSAGDESRQTEKLSLVVDGDSDSDEKLLAASAAFETSEAQPSTDLPENTSTDIESREPAKSPEPVTDKQDQLDTEAESEREEVNAETSEACHDINAETGELCREINEETGELCREESTDNGK